MATISTGRTQVKISQDNRKRPFEYICPKWNKIPVDALVVVRDCQSLVVRDGFDPGQLVQPPRLRHEGSIGPFRLH